MGLFDTPQTTLLVFGQIVTVVVAIIALVGNIGARKVKTPADDLARAEFAYTKIKERLAEVDGDRKFLSETNEALREALQRADNEATATIEEKRNLRRLIEQGDQRIAELESANRVLNARLENIAEKVRTHQPITLTDVYGGSNVVDITTGSLEVTDHLGLGDVEMTQTRNDLRHKA